MTVEKEFNPLSEYFEQNPYKELQRMRESCRAYRHEGTLMPVTSVFHNNDIRKMLLDWKTCSSQRSEEYNKKALGDASILIGNDPPTHTMYRNIVAPLFLPKAVRPLTPIIDKQIDRALEQCLGAGEVNFVEDFAANVTIGLICSICGIPEDDWSLMRSMTLDLARDDGRAVFWKEPNPAVESRIGKVMENMTDYFNDHIKFLNKSSKENILSSLAAQIDNPRHLVGLCILIVGAGNETTTNLLAHGLQELIRHPEQMSLLKNKPEMMECAVEEMLRYRGTIRKQDRIAGKDIEIDGIKIYEGESIALWNASASRDPAVIESPEKFDIRRNPNRHLALGSGIHMCIGNVLARLEVSMAFKRLFAATSKIVETRGTDSYESLKNGVLEGAKRYSVKLESA